jgi:penicillin-binding protein 1B
VTSSPARSTAFVAHRRRVYVGLAIAAAAAITLMLPAIHRIWKLTATLPVASGPSRLYGAGFQISPGQDQRAVRSALTSAEYHEVKGSETNLRRGAFVADDRGFDVALREFPVESPTHEGGRLEIQIADDQVKALRLGGKVVSSAELDPPLLASYYGAQAEERWPVRLDELPPSFVQSVLAAEDGDFLHHGGISLSGTLRALWVDVRSLRPRQGGSTITQQLAKILYLNSRRTLSRKLEEAALAICLELRYSKQSLLEAYLNQAYWGRSEGLTLRGVGAASRAFFGKDPQSLTLTEGALLAGMIRAPAEYTPVDHPAAALARRNVVLTRLARRGWISAATEQTAMSAPLGVTAPLAPRADVPYFAAAAASEARQRYGVQDLNGTGYLLFSTLDLNAQEEAELAVASGLAAVEGRARRTRPFEAALVSVDPHDGSILAYVGGRDPRHSVFDRAGQARRQLGSAFKPVVYAAAFEAGIATPFSMLDDSPVAVNTSHGVWEPQNFDREFRGPVTARMALEQSLNVPTVRLAFETGLNRVADMAEQLGLGRPSSIVPSLALGAIDASPREVAGLYATLAAGGLKPTVHSLRGVITPDGEWKTAPTDEPRRVMPVQTAFEVTSILEGVIEHGTAASLGGHGMSGLLAGKTGTTSDGRDSWFAGYSADRVTVVWVGHDDDSPSALTGASGAAPLWGRFMRAVQPSHGFAAMPPPEGMQWVSLDPDTGELATPLCPRRITELVPAWQAPAVPCHVHTGATAVPAAFEMTGAIPNDPAAGTPTQVTVVVRNPPPTGGPS